MRKDAIGTIGSLKSARDQAYSEGRALRKTLPRASHAIWKPSMRNGDPMEMLLATSENRLRDLIYRNAGQGVALSREDLKREIDADKPFIIASYQHYMVATGYEEQEPARSVLYWDPLPTNRGRDGRMSYERYCTMIRTGGATYHGFSGPNRQ